MSTKWLMGIELEERAWQRLQPNAQTFISLSET